MLRVGLTGGIACGKTFVLRQLAERGCRTLDLDAVARAVTAPGSEALAEIRAAFGGGVLDAEGALDRAALGALVFGDAPARARLNRIVHPRVRAAEADWAREFAKPGSREVLVTDGALIVESGVHLRFDRLVVVHCAPELQLRRLRERDGLGDAAARARIGAQLPSAAKRAFAHFDIDSSGAPGDTQQAAFRLAEALHGLAREARAEAPPCVLDRLAAGLAHGAEDGPRGLSPALLLSEAQASGGFDMEGLARRLESPPSGLPWYRSAEAAPPRLKAARLGVAVAAWVAAARAAHDPELTASAAASVALLTHADPAERAAACLVALMALARASASRAALAARPDEHSRALAARFGGGEPAAWLDAVWAALERAPADPVAAGEACVRLGGDGPAAAALAGLHAVSPADSWPRQGLAPSAGDGGLPEDRAARWRDLLRALRPHA